MRSELQRKIIQNLKSQEKKINEIADIMKMSSNTTINMYYYERKVTPHKRGPHFRINNYQKLRIKRQVAQLKKEEEKINQEILLFTDFNQNHSETFKMRRL